MIEEKARKNRKNQIFFPYDRDRGCHSPRSDLESGELEI